MKKLLFLMISSLASFTLCAQTASNPFKKLYFECGGGAATSNGSFAQLGAKAVLKNNWTASVSYYNVEANPKNLPSNYEPGYTVFFIFPVPDAMPSVEMKMINFTAGRFFPLGRKTWITTEAGLSIVSGKTFEFTPQKVETNWFYWPSNYSSETKSKTTLGGMIRTDITWACTPFLGMSLGGFANLNSIQSPVGVELKLIAGWLNTKRTHKK
jgi:hypothetical protein